jgi:hypothetical protein
LKDSYAKSSGNPITTFVGAEETLLKLEPPAIVAVTEQVPVAEFDKVDPLTVQGPELTTYVTVPPLLPPEVVRASVEPKVPDVEVNVSAD